MAARIARLSILDSYGVRWTRESFARDLLQNFFDSAADFREIALEVRRDAGVVEIRGPATFDIDLLAYIGATTKTTGRTVGGFGEGFKICALIGARDFGLAITAGSDAHEIAVFFDPVPLGRELCYRVTTREGDPLPGSYVRLEGCDAATLAAFEAAPTMFRHPDNPALAEPLVVDMEQGIGVYRALDPGAGELYYRRQRRGTARFYGSSAERALTLAHDEVIDALEGDRDRRDLPAEPLARAIGDKLSPEDLHRVILELMPQWRYGNDVLSGLLAAGIARKLRFEWPARWLARSHKSPGLAQFAERQGFSIALASFAELGMRTPEQNYGNLETRAASPLERARFDVVSDLHRELLGYRAKATELEVFDLAGSAVAGQHLGDKVIVAADLFARGFDAVAGTVLHELAHEAGPEEDIRFLRRLTNLLGAAIREPEKIRAARRRYAAARPARPRAKKPAGASAPPARAYMPELSNANTDIGGVTCTLVIPPGFPPSVEVVAAIRAAGREEGVNVWVNAVQVSGPIGAHTWQTPGLPTVYIGGVDPEGGSPPGSGAPPAYRLRTYGPEGRALVPDAESLRAAIRRARKLGLAGCPAWQIQDEITAGRRERVRAALGIELPPEKKDRPPAPHEVRAAALRNMLQGFIDGESGFDLSDVWAHGQAAAIEAWIRAARFDLRPVQALFEEISTRLDLAVEHAEALRDADPDYDDADTFERDAMLAAMGASVSGYALGADEAGREATSGEAFRVVRAAATRVLDLDITLEAKVAVLIHAIKCAGLGWEHGARKRSFEPPGFEAGLARGADEALRMQREIDESGGWFSVRELNAKLDPFAQDPRVVRRTLKNQRKWERYSRATHAIHEVYDRALAESGSELAAAARALEEAARLVPEARR